MTLRKQAVTILAAVLAGELCLLAIMAFLLFQSEELAARAERSSKIVAEATLALKSVLDSTRALANVGVKRDESSRLFFFESVQELKECGRSLQELKSRAPEDEQLFSSIQADSAQLIDLLESIKNTLQSSSVRVDVIDYVRLFNAGKKELPEVMRRVKRDLTELMKRHEGGEEALKAKSIRKILTLVIVCGIVLNVGTCSVLVFTFFRRIVNRLAVLRENTQNLVQSRPLLPLVGGSDEIAELDRLFHRMSAALQAATERDKFILTSMPCGVVTFSQAMVIEFANPTFEKMTGFSAPEVVGREIKSIFAGQEILDKIPGGDENQGWRKMLGKVEQAVVVCREGEPLVADVSFAAYSGEHGESFVCNILDVTDRCEMEEMKRELVNIVSHDLRSPVTAIQAVFRLIDSDAYGEVNAAGKTAIHRSIDECSRLVKLISDLLTMSRIESGKLRLEFANCSLWWILDRSISSVTAYAEEKEVSIQLSGQDVTLEADESRLIQVFVNLLSNAIKYSPAGETVAVRTEQSERVAKVTVGDKGCGIPKEAQQHIFERFAQVRPSDEQSGSGLGLTICQLIVDGHHGRIGLCSEEGQGAEFWVELPVLQTQ